MKMSDQSDNSITDVDDKILLIEEVDLFSFK
jgi:hypothetical protein